MWNETHQQRKSGWSGIQINDLGYKSSALPSELSSPMMGPIPFITNIFAMGASQKPYNLACRVTEDHTQFHRYNPESNREGI